MIAANPRPLDAEAYAVGRMRGFDLPAAERDADHTLQELHDLADLAESSGDPEAIETTASRLAKALAHQARYAEALPILVAAEQRHHELVQAVLRADAMWRGGSPDADVAVALVHGLFAADAAERHHRATMPAIRSATSSPLHAIAAMGRDADARAWADVLAETKGLGDLPFSPYSSVGDAISKAGEYGRAANAKRAVFWKMAEQIVEGEWLPRAKKARKNFAAGYEWEGNRHTPPGDEDLTSVFAARRAGFASARSSALAAASELGL